MGLGNKGWLFIMTAAMLLMGAPVYGEEVIVNGTGPTAKAALRSAFQAAMEQVVGTVVDSRTYVQNYEVIKDRIYARTEGYVKNYSILKEEEREGHYVITAKVNVDTSLQSAFRSELDKIKTVELGLNNPRIAVFISNDRREIDDAAQAVILQTLCDSGFSRVVDANQIDTMVSKRLAAANISGDFSAITMLHTQSQIDYLVTGKIKTARTDSGFRNANIETARASLAIQVFKCDNAEMIASTQVVESGADIAQSTACQIANSNAGQAAGRFIAGKLLNYAANSNRNITVYIYRLQNRSDLHKVEGAFNDMPGVNSVYIRNFNSGMAVVDISFAGDTNTLAAYVENTFTSRVKRQTDSTLDVYFH